MRSAILIFVGLLFAILIHALAASPQPQTQVVARSRLSDGNLSRLQAAMLKAQHGQPVTIGFIGGSITYGERATAIDRQYATLVTRWWVDHFPQSQITMINAGVPGTGSNYGCLRVARDLLSHHPDFVVVEFGVNDKDDLAHAQTYEGVIRQLMENGNNPAVVLLFMMHHDGTNAQAFQSEIGKQYQLPMISFRDAIWPEIAAARLQLSDVLADTVHPNNQGHALIAAYINSLLEETLNHLPGRIAENASLPSPRFTDLFSKTQLIGACNLNPTTANGWTFNSQRNCWISNQPGSTIDFAATGRLIDLLYARVSTNAGTVAVSVDDQPPVICDSWFDGTWTGYCQTDVVGSQLSSGMHKVHIELLNEKNALSTGNEFRIMGLGTAGR